MLMVNNNVSRKLGPVITSLAPCVFLTPSVCFVVGQLCLLFRSGCCCCTVIRQKNPVCVPFLPLRLGPLFVCPFVWNSSCDVPYLSQTCPYAAHTPILWTRKS